MLDHLLICGLGSIGRRHLELFRALGVKRIDAFRTGMATLPDVGRPAPDRTFRSLDEALGAGPQAVVVCNPTSLHVATALAAVRAGAHVLIEKPLAGGREGIAELRQAALAERRTVGVAFNLRFHPALMAAKEMVDSQTPLGVPLMMRAHFGAYLPDWHPWEDYRRSYAARRDLGGGAALTHSHEIDYVSWLLGPVTACRGLAAAATPLGTDVDEATALVLRHAGGAVSSVTLSLAQKPATRGFELACTQGLLRVDLLAGTWCVQTAAGQIAEHRVPAGFEFGLTYRAQALAFLEAIAGKPNSLATLDEAEQAVGIALAIRKEIR